MYIRRPSIGFGRGLKLLSDRFEVIANSKLAEIGLTLAQAQALLVIFESYDTHMTAISLSSELSVSQPTVAGLVKRLTAKGLLVANPDYVDRRARILEITPEGERLCPIAAKLITSAESELVDKLTDEQRRFLSETILSLVGRV